MIIDMYYRAVDRQYGFGRRARELGIEHELDYYYDRLDSTVVPNLKRMLEACRKYSIDVVHVKVGTHTLDGRDAGWRYKGWKIFKELKAEHEIIAPLQPVEGGNRPHQDEFQRIQFDDRGTDTPEYGYRISDNRRSGHWKLRGNPGPRCERP